VLSQSTCLNGFLRIGGEDTKCQNPEARVKSVKSDKSSEGVVKENKDNFKSITEPKSEMKYHEKYNSYNTLDDEPRKEVETITANKITQNDSDSLFINMCLVTILFFFNISGYF